MPLIHSDLRIMQIISIFEILDYNNFKKKGCFFRNNPKLITKTTWPIGSKLKVKIYLVDPLEH